VAWTADRIELISSRLGQGPSHGAAYDTVGEWSFLG
jgi:RNA 2',3'-cyclic 3'-phosphodiesterase